QKLFVLEKSQPKTCTSQTPSFGSASNAPPEPCMSRPAQSRSEAHATKSPDLTSAEPTLKYRQPSGDVDLTRSGRSSDRIYEANPAVLSSREEKQHGSASTPVCASCRAMKTRNSSSALNVARYSSPANSKI